MYRNVTMKTILNKQNVFFFKNREQEGKIGPRGVGVGTNGKGEI
jgi:hypothetical protein